MNRTTGNSQCEPEWFFPLLLMDLNQAFVENVVPLILPRMASFGLMVLGRAGIGKTPTAQILALAVARHLECQSPRSGWNAWVASFEAN